MSTLEQRRSPACWRHREIDKRGGPPSFQRALGLDVLRQPTIWRCVVGIAVTGVLNLAVSVYLAFKVVLRA